MELSINFCCSVVIKSANGSAGIFAIGIMKCPLWPQYMTHTTMKLLWSGKVKLLLWKVGCHRVGMRVSVCVLFTCFLNVFLVFLYISFAFYTTALMLLVQQLGFIQFQSVHFWGTCPSMESIQKIGWLILKFVVEYFCVNFTLCHRGTAEWRSNEYVESFKASFRRAFIHFELLLLVLVYSYFPLNVCPVTCFACSCGTGCLQHLAIFARG